MKKFLSRLFHCKSKEKKVHLSTEQKTNLNVDLQNLQNSVPLEFNRKLEGGTKTIMNWKASEYCLLMIYVGFVLFSNSKIFGKSVYVCFLCLGIAMRTLLTDGQEKNMPTIQKLMCLFIEKCRSVFGDSFIC